MEYRNRMACDLIDRRFEDCRFIGFQYVDLEFEGNGIIATQLLRFKLQYILRGKEIQKYLKSSRALASRDFVLQIPKFKILLRPYKTKKTGGLRQPTKGRANFAPPFKTLCGCSIWYPFFIFGITRRGHGRLPWNGKAPGQNVHTIPGNAVHARARPPRQY